MVEFSLSHPIRAVVLLLRPECTVERIESALGPEWKRRRVFDHLHEPVEVAWELGRRNVQYMYDQTYELRTIEIGGPQAKQLRTRLAAVLPTMRPSDLAAMLARENPHDLTGALIACRLMPSPELRDRVAELEHHADEAVHRWAQSALADLDHIARSKTGR